MKTPLKARGKLEYIYVTSAIKGLYLIGELLPKEGVRKTMTNFEKVKSMGVNEMANIIFNGISSNSCDYCGNQSNGDYSHCFDCTVNTDIIANWLESEVEG